MMRDRSGIGVLGRWWYMAGGGGEDESDRSESACTVAVDGRDFWKVNLWEPSLEYTKRVPGVEEAVVGLADAPSRSLVVPLDLAI